MNIEIQKILNSEYQHIGSDIAGSFYLGIDLTSDSIHLGHVLLIKRSILLLKKLKSKMWILLGNFTTLLGDPTGKSKERPILTTYTIEKNFRNILLQLIKLTKGFKVNFILNSLWWNRLSVKEYLTILRNFSLNKALKQDFFQSRLKKGNRISISELCYPSLQSYDHKFMFTRFKCRGQVAGLDQLGNISDAISFCGKESTWGVLFPLLVDEKGIKLGKSNDLFKIIWSEKYQDHFQFFQRLNKPFIKKQLQDINIEDLMLERGYSGELKNLIDGIKSDRNLKRILVEDFNVKNLKSANQLVKQGKVSINKIVIIDPQRILKKNDVIKFGNKIRKAF